MSRYADKCPNCGGDMLIGTVGGIAPHIEQAGYTGLTAVVMHAHPLCESARLDSEHVKKDVADKIAEVAARKEARENAIRKIREEEEAKVQKRIQKELEKQE